MVLRNQYDLESIENHQRAVARAARAVVAGDMSIIDGARILSRVGAELTADPWDDAEFRLFALLDSETDHLPTDTQRGLWDPAAFEEKQRNVRRIEAAYRDEVIAACERLIRRFGGV